MSGGPFWHERDRLLALLEGLSTDDRISALREALEEEQRIADAIKRGALERRAFHDALDVYVAAANDVLDAWPDGDTTGYPEGLASFDEHCSALMGWRYEEKRATAAHEVSEEKHSPRALEGYPCDTCGAPLDNDGKGWSVMRPPGSAASGFRVCCSLCAGVDPATGDGLDYRDRLRARGFALGQVGGNCRAWIRPIEGGFIQVWSDAFRSDLEGEEIYQARFDDGTEEAIETIVYPSASDALRDLHRYAEIETVLARPEPEPAE